MSNCSSVGYKVTPIEPDVNRISEISQLLLLQRMKTPSDADVMLCQSQQKAPAFQPEPSAYKEGEVLCISLSLSGNYDE